MKGLCRGSLQPLIVLPDGLYCSECKRRATPMTKDGVKVAIRHPVHPEGALR